MSGEKAQKFRQDKIGRDEVNRFLLRFEIGDRRLMILVAQVEQGDEGGGINKDFQRGPSER